MADYIDKEEEAAEAFFNKLSTHERSSIQDDLILGTIDWLDWDMEKPSMVFRNKFYKLLNDWERMIG